VIEIVSLMLCAMNPNRPPFHGKISPGATVLQLSKKIDLSSGLEKLDHSLLAPPDHSLLHGRFCLPEPPVIENDYIYTAREVAVFLRVSYDTIARYCRRGILPSFKAGGQWRVRESALCAFMDSSYAACSPALREPSREITSEGKPRQRRAPFAPRPHAKRQPKPQQEAATT